MKKRGKLLFPAFRKLLQYPRKGSYFPGKTLVSSYPVRVGARVPVFSNACKRQTIFVESGKWSAG